MHKKRLEQVSPILESPGVLKQESNYSAKRKA